MPFENGTPLIAHAVWVLVLTAFVPAQTQWKRVSVPPRAGAPLPRDSHALAYDEFRDEVVLFGGGTYNGTALADTWVWNGTDWTRRSPPSAPGLKGNHAMAFDGTRVILFGGAFTDETWAWDGATWSLLQPVTRPSARSGQVMAYDRVRGRVVLFGGYRNVTVFQDTWEWDGSRWVLVPSPVAPTGLGLAMAYDEHRQRSVLLTRESSSMPLQTWEWDGTSWIKRSPAVTPPTRSIPAMAYDARSRRVVLFGGRDLTDFRDTWEWDGTSWTERILVEPPPGRAFHAMVQDRRRGELLMFGGNSYPFLFDDTWTLDANGWTYRGPETNPLPRTGPAIAYDSSRQRAVLVGGTLENGQPVGRDAETWEFDGTVWRPRFPSRSPSTRVAHDAVDDTVRDRVVLFGGYGLRAMSDTWEWDGGDWLERTVAMPPPARSGHAMVFDPVRARTIVFGGVGGDGVPLDDTWQWDGASWTSVMTATRPPARSFHGLAHDTLRGRTVLFGGTTVDPSGGGGVLADTWELDGTRWVQMQPATTPTARSLHALVYDDERGRTVLFGGWDGSAVLADAWEWDGRDWRRVAPAPAARFAHGATYDTGKRRVISFGGADLAGKYDDTWEYVPSVRHRVLGYGAGCAGTNGIPELGALGPPILGNRDFALRFGAGRPNANAVAVLSVANASIPLPGGCTVLVQPPWVAVPATLDALGGATIAAGVPSLASVRGLSVFGQGIVADPLGSFWALAFTAGLQLVIGD